MSMTYNELWASLSRAARTYMIPWENLYALVDIFPAKAKEELGSITFYKGYPQFLWGQPGEHGRVLVIRGNSVKKFSIHYMGSDGTAIDIRELDTKRDGLSIPEVKTLVESYFSRYFSTPNYLIEKVNLPTKDQLSCDPVTRFDPEITPDYIDLDKER